LFIYVVAFCTYTLETLFDILKTAVDAVISTQKPHTLQFYQTLALNFQYGFNTLPDDYLFDNTGHTTDEITASKIINYAACIEQANIYGRLFVRFKLAHDNGTDLEELSGDQIDALTDYLNTCAKDAGVPLIVDSLPPDSTKQTWTIYYNPLILNSNGSRIDGGAATPVQDAIKRYLRQQEQGGGMPFNGIYVPEYHEDYVSLIDGVVIAKQTTCQAQYGLLPFTQIGDKYTPDAGYMRFDSDDDLDITFIAQSPIK
jgi:hypothetical protein